MVLMINFTSVCKSEGRVKDARRSFEAAEEFRNSNRIIINCQRMMANRLEMSRDVNGMAK